MRNSFPWQLSVLLLVGMTAAAHVENSIQSSQSPSSQPAENATPPSASETPTTATKVSPEITVTGKAPHDEPSLPALPPDEFTDCMKQNGLNGLEQNGVMQLDPRLLVVCEAKLAWEQRIVVEACINRDGKSALRRVIQACTESLDHKIFQGRDRYYLFAGRADAYFAQGDKPRALDDYNEAVKLAPKNAKLHYNRGVFYAAQFDGEAALRDFNIALSINPKLIPALQQRAKIYLTQDNFGGALADYSEAVRLQPKTAALWSERGYVCLRLRDYEGAIKDEAEAIRLDPKLARAYFLRGAAYGDLGNSPNAVSDILTAVRLDPSLDRYVSTKGKTASLTLPPL
jgi:Flp pilus assembly protein TadD